MGVEGFILFCLKMCWWLDTCGGLQFRGANSSTFDLYVACMRSIPFPPTVRSRDEEGKEERWDPRATQRKGQDNDDMPIKWTMNHTYTHMHCGAQCFALVVLLLYCSLCGCMGRGGVSMPVGYEACCIDQKRGRVAKIHRHCSPIPPLL